MQKIAGFATLVIFSCASLCGVAVTLPAPHTGVGQVVADDVAGGGVPDAPAPPTLPDAAAVVGTLPPLPAPTPSTPGDGTDTWGWG
jgi:hypothetical protein